MPFLTATTGPPLTEALPSLWLFEQIEAWSRRAPERFAFVLDHQDRLEQYRYSDVLDQAAAMASHLMGQGIRRGDRIGILMENTPQWVFVLLGAMQIGAVTVPLATTLPEDAIERIVTHAGCRIVFADEANWTKGCNVARTVGAICDRALAQGGGPPPPKKQE